MGVSVAPSSTTTTGSAAQRAPVRARRLGHRLRRGLLYFMLYGGAAVFLIPLIWMFLTAIKTLQETYAFPPTLLPHVAQWQNFKTAWTTYDFTLYTYHTLFITVTSMVGVIATSSLCAYGFARLHFWGRDVLFLCVIASVMLPFTVTVLPLYIIFRDLGWLNTFKPLIIPAWFGGGAFNIFLLRQFFQTIPRDLDESARIDGCSTFGIFWRILLPLAKPALAVVAIFWFQASWTDFLGPVIYLNSTDQYTLALGVYQFAADASNIAVHHEELLMCVAFAMVLPVALVFLAAQRYMIRGVVLSGIKG
jgi:ABC-type glycerol-3-phosphate transport system permease component